jgi:hypothetical protein
MTTTKTLKRCTSLILAIVLTTLLATTAAAAETRASTLIFSHSCVASMETDGEINVTFSITGKKIMSRIGAQSMYFYVKDGNTWTLSKSYGQYSTGMSTTNKVTYDNTITYQGSAGAQYKIVVTLFVKDSEGETDTRTYTKYV